MLLAFLIVAAKPMQEAHKVMERYISCPPTGLHRSGKRPTGKELQLNLLKNRYLAPTTFDPSVTLEQMAQGNVSRWPQNQNMGAKITGYVAFIIPNILGEGCNCYKQDDAHTDTHVDLVANEKDASEYTKHVIIEITPRIKYLARKQGKDWSTNGLVKQFYRKWVNVEGWLLYDFEHEKHARNTNPKHLDKVWRASCWEIHPVTNIELSQH